MHLIWPLIFKLEFSYKTVLRRWDLPLPSKGHRQPGKQKSSLQRPGNWSSTCTAIQHYLGVSLSECQDFCVDIHKIVLHSWRPEKVQTTNISEQEGWSM